MEIIKTVTLNAGELEPIYVALKADSGTDTILGGTVTLKDRAGVPVVNEAEISGFTPGALAEPQVWYDLDTLALALSAGSYTLQFTINHIGSDGEVRRSRPAVLILVQ